MEIITRQTLANDISRQWARQYRYNSSGDFKDEIQLKLDALGKVKDPDKVDAIIGNTGWTELTPCSECRKTPQGYVIELGEPYEYNSQTVYLCPDCIEKAWNLVQEAALPLGRFTQIEKQLTKIKEHTAHMEPQNAEATKVLQAAHTFETELEKLLKEHEWAFIELGQNE